MKLKTQEIDGQEYAVIQDGKPVYVDDSGKEHVYDAPAMRGSLDRLNKSLSDQKREYDELKKTAEALDGIDPEAARKALDTVKNLDDKKLIDAGEVDSVVKQRLEEASKSWEQKLAEAKKEAEETKSMYAREKTASAFNGSKFVKERLAIPPDIVQKTFGDHFRFENGRHIPIDSNGNPMYSDSNPGEVASFDEALEKIVSQYPNRDSILKGSGNSGSGAGPVDTGGKRILSREQFSKLSPQEQGKMAAAAREGKVTIND